MAQRPGGAGSDGFVAASPSPDGHPTPDVVLAVPDGATMLTVPVFLPTATFARVGGDLLITDVSGKMVLITGYFDGAAPPALVTESGKLLPADLVETLAGPLSPGQYAQLEGGIEAIPIGRVTEVSGTVTVTRADGTETELVQDSPVFQGDVLSTGDDAAIAITFVDATVFSLGSNGRMVLDELVFDPTTLEGESTVSVLQGVFVFVSGEIAANNPDEMIVRTPVATIGVRGTRAGGMGAEEGEWNTVVLLPESELDDGSGQQSSGALTIWTLASQEEGAPPVVLDSPYEAVRVASVFDRPLAFDMNPDDAVTTFGEMAVILPSSDILDDIRREIEDTDNGLAGWQQTHLDPRVTWRELGFEVGRSDFLGIEEVDATGFDLVSFITSLQAAGIHTDTIVQALAELVIDSGFSVTIDGEAYTTAQIAAELSDLISNPNAEVPDGLIAAIANNVDQVADQIIAAADANGEPVPESVSTTVAQAAADAIASAVANTLAGLAPEAGGDGTEGTDGTEGDLGLGPASLDPDFVTVVGSTLVGGGTLVGGTLVGGSLIGGQLSDGADAGGTLVGGTLLDGTLSGDSLLAATLAAATAAGLGPDAIGSADGFLEQFIALVDDLGLTDATTSDEDSGNTFLEQIADLLGDGDAGDIVGIGGGGGGGGVAGVSPSEVFLTTTFFDAGNEGVRANYVLNLQPGQSASLLWYNGLAAPGGLVDSTVLAAFLDTFVIPGSPLLAGLNDAQLAQIANYDLGDGVGQGVIGGIGVPFDPNIDDATIDTRATNGALWDEYFNSGNGFVLDDAELAGFGDAYDSAGNILVEGQAYFADNPAFLDGTRVTSSGVAGGLQVETEGLFFENLPVWRTLASFTNPSADPVSAIITWQTNLGADDDTTVLTTSDGDTVFEATDRFIITFEDDFFLSDPTTIFTFFGGAPNTAPIAPRVEVSVAEEALDLAQDGNDLAPADVIGSDPGLFTESVVFNINFQSIDPATITGIALGDVSDGGPVVGNVGVPFAGTTGVIQIEEDGSAVFTMTTNFEHNSAVIGEVFTYTVTDITGDTDTNVIVIELIDDAPIARDDFDTIADLVGVIANGNVITGAGTDVPASGADIGGADGGPPGGGFHRVSGVEAGLGAPLDDPTTLGIPIVGAFGTLELDFTGAYVYTVTDPSAPAGGREDTFTYTLQDLDGSLSTATLTINLQEAVPGFPVVLSENTTGFPDTVYTGPPDDNHIGLGGQTVTYDFDPFVIVDLPGPDFNIYEVDFGAPEFGSMTVAVSLDGINFVDVSATASAVVPIPGDETHSNDAFARSFDLAGSGLDEVRFVRVDGNGDGAAGGNNGFDLEAMGAINLALAGAPPPPPLITLAFEGVVTSIGAAVDDGTFSIGDPISGQYSFDPTGVPFFDVHDLSFAFGAYLGEDADLGRISATNDLGGGAAGDLYVYRGAPATGPDVNGLAVETFNLQLRDPSATALLSNTIPLLPDIDAFEQNNGNTTFLILQFDRGLAPGTSGQIRGTPTAINLVDTGGVPFAAPTEAIVFESALDGDLDGADLGSSGAVGSDPLSNDETFQGVLNAVSGNGFLVTGVTAGDTGGAPVAGGVGFTFAGAFGLLNLNAAGGFTYTLTTPAAHLGGTVEDIFTYTITETAGGEQATSTLTVQIIDDAPFALADTDEADAVLGAIADGNVVTGDSTTSGAAGADVLGADGSFGVAPVVGVAPGDTGIALQNAATVGGPVPGTFGDLVLNGDGGYIYTVTDSVVPAGSVDTFTYTIDDGDGSLDLATLDITLGGGGAPFLPSVTPSNVFENTNFAVKGFEGIRAEYTLDLAPGETVGFLWFNGLAVDEAAGIALAAQFDAVALGSPLLSGLTDGQLANVVNYDFGLAVAPEGIAVPAAGQFNPDPPTQDLNLLATAAQANWINFGNNVTSGFVLEDGILAASGANQFDGYDGAGSLLINGFEYAPTQAFLNDTTVNTFGLVGLGSFDVASDWFFFEDQAVWRAFTTITNTTANVLQTIVTWQHNTGTDTNMSIAGTSDGDTVFEATDSTVVVTDGAFGSDPVTVFSLFGATPPAPAINVVLGDPTNEDLSAFATNGIDLIIGDEGFDTFDGLGDNDILIGDGAFDPGQDANGTALPVIDVAGSDSIHGGDGNDTIYGDFFDEFSDLSLSDTNPDLVNLLDGAIEEGGNDTLTGGDGVDIIIGGGGNDAIGGGANVGGIEMLFGGFGSDNINGGDDSDFIAGGHGNDLISGGFGDDFILGGPGFNEFFGQDLLSGGGGADAFIYSNILDGTPAQDGDVGRTDGDQISDFLPGVDVIRILDLAPDVGDVEGPLQDGIDFFTVDNYDGTNAGASPGEEYFVFDPQSDTLYFDEDATQNGYVTVATFTNGAQIGSANTEVVFIDNLLSPVGVP